MHARLTVKVVDASAAAAMRSASWPACARCSAARSSAALSAAARSGSPPPAASSARRCASSCAHRKVFVLASADCCAC